MMNVRKQVATARVAASAKRVAGWFLALGVMGTTMACYVEASSTAPREECRTTVRRRADVEACVTRCNDDGCRTHCRESETWSRQHRCWVE
jgi:SH3-like domain-containing protein